MNKKRFEAAKRKKKLVPKVWTIKEMFRIVNNEVKKHFDTFTMNVTAEMKNYGTGTYKDPSLHPFTITIYLNGGGIHTHFYGVSFTQAFLKLKEALKYADKNIVADSDTISHTTEDIPEDLPL